MFIYIFQPELQLKGDGTVEYLLLSRDKLCDADADFYHRWMPAVETTAREETT